MGGINGAQRAHQAGCAARLREGGVQQKHFPPNEKRKKRIPSSDKKRPRQRGCSPTEFSCVMLLSNWLSSASSMSAVPSSRHHRSGLNRPRGIRPHRNFDRSHRAVHEPCEAAFGCAHKRPSIFPPRIQELSFLRILGAAAMQAFD